MTQDIRLSDEIHRLTCPFSRT